MITFKVNGVARKFDGDPEMPLLWYLRDEIELTGTKYGCGEGLCGACTVHVNGAAVRSCQTQMQSLAGKSVTTIEGLSAVAKRRCKVWRRLERDGNASGAAGLETGQRSAMRVLPDRADHAGGGAAKTETETDRRGH